MGKVVWALAVCVSSMATADVIAGDAPTFAELKTAVFTAREALVRGQVIYHVEGTASLPEQSGGPPRQQKYVQDMTVWFDGDRLREDRTHDGYKAVSCFGCLPDRMHVYYDNESLPRGEMALVATDYSETTPSLDAVVDPRWIGLFPAELKVNLNFPLEMVRGTFWQEVPPGNARITKDRISDNDCWRAEWQCENNGVVINMRAWIGSASSQILRIEEKYEQWGQKFSFRLEEESEAVRGRDGKDHHVPVLLKFSRTIDGELRGSEVAEIEYVSLNEPLDERIFSLEGIDFLKPGTPVVWASERNRPGEEGELVWDGERIAVTRLGTDEMAARLTFSPVRSLLIFGTLGVCAAFLVWYFLRRIRMKAGR